MIAQSISDPHGQFEVIPGGRGRGRGRGLVAILYGSMGGKCWYLSTQWMLDWTTGQVFNTEVKKQSIP